MASALLQTVKSDLRNTQDRQKFTQRTIKMSISAVVGAARPDNADSRIVRLTQKQRRILFAPSERRRIQIGNICWDCVEGGFENMGQAHQWQIGVKFCHANLSWFADLADARYCRKDRHQVLGTGEYQILATLRC